MPSPIYDVAVLLSGGVDSMVVAEMARRKGRLFGCFGIDYGQPSRIQELSAAKQIAHFLRADYYELRASIGSLEPMDCGVGVQGPRVIPGRNAAMLSTVAGHRLSRGGFREIWFGAIADDQAEYEDCRPDFIDRMSRTLPVSVHAPLIGVSKEHVIEQAYNMGLPLHLAWSCYQPTEYGDACHTCNSCMSRRNAQMAVMYQRGLV